MPEYELAGIEGHYALQDHADVYDSHASVPTTTRPTVEFAESRNEHLSTDAGRRIVAMSLPGFVKKGYEPPSLPFGE